MVRIILDTELQQKHNQNRKHEAIKLCNDIKQSVGFILFNAIIYHIGQSIKFKASFIKERHSKKAFQFTQKRSIK